MKEREETTANYAEYIRTSRFGRVDNTFVLGYIGKEPSWAWELKAGVTPKADVMYRQMGELILYMPTPGIKIEPMFRGNYRRYTGAKVMTSELGLRWTPAPGWDATGRWGRIQTALLDETGSKNSSPSSYYQVGYLWSDLLRVFAYQSSLEEFFDPGNPDNPSAYSLTERGGGFWWTLDQGLRLMGSYGLEQRSNNTSIKKFGITFQQTY